MSTFHTSPTWKRVREAAVFRWYSDGCPPCALCGQAIEDERPVVDHKVQVTDGGAKYDLDNLRCVHSRCNCQPDRGAQLLGQTEAGPQD
jgi:5-methylcytosine-specific restriction endonuclease McrA